MDTSSSKGGTLAARTLGQLPAEHFVGRAAELDLLSRCISSAALGSGSLAIISGDAGIGKTRLGQEAAGIASRWGLSTFWGRCWDSEDRPVFWPWAQVIRSYARAVPEGQCKGALGPHAADISRVVSGLPEWLSDGTGNYTKLHEGRLADRFLLYDSFLAFLRRASSIQPMLVVIDDLQNADPDSLLLLEFLADHIVELPIAIVVIYRKGPVLTKGSFARVLSSISRHSWAQQIALVGLGHDEVARLLEALVGTTPTTDITNNLQERTDGNPFFLRELAALLPPESRSREDIVERLQGALPHTVRQMAAAYLRATSQGCRQALGVAAVLGREFHPTLLTHLANLTTVRIETLLSEAIYCGILTRHDSGYYRFAHGIVREIIYESLSPAEKANLHQRAANLLETKPFAGIDSRASAIAHHRRFALPFGSASSAVNAALLAGRDAQLRFAHEQAIEHFSRGLELWPLDAEDPMRCELLLALGEAQGNSGLWSESKATFLLAANVARKLKRAEDFARAAIGFKGMMGATAPIDVNAAVLLREAAGMLTSDHGELLVRVLTALSRCLYFGNAPDEIASSSRRALDVAHQIGSDRVYLLAVEAQLMSIWNHQHLSEIFEMATRMLEVALNAHNPDMVFSARMYRHYSLLSRGEWATSYSELKYAEIVASECGSVAYGWHVPMIRAARALVMGRFERSLHLSLRARELGERVHDSSPLHNYMLQMFQHARLTGEFGGIEVASAAAEDQFPEIVGYRAGLALVSARKSKLERARNILTALGRNHYRDLPLDSLTLWTLTVLAETAAICGEDTCRKDLYDQLKPYDGMSVVASWGSAFDGAVSHYLGLLAASLREWDRAKAHFERALVENAACDSEPLVARTKYYYAESILGAGSERALNSGLILLESSLEVFDRLRMSGFAELAERLRIRYKAAIRRDVEAPADVADNKGDRSTHEGELGRFVFRRESGFWTIVFEGKVLRAAQCKGLGMIAALLCMPESDVHVLDLVQMAERDPDDTLRLADRAATSRRLGDAGPLIDERARAEYRSRAADLQDELIEAQRCNDIGRIERIREELEAIEGELSRAYGRRGVVRVAGAASERARVRVRNNITAALTKIRRDGGEALFRHLDAAIRTGMVCSYRPERPIPWEF